MLMKLIATKFFPKRLLKNMRVSSYPVEDIYAIRVPNLVKQKFYRKVY